MQLQTSLNKNQHDLSRKTDRLYLFSSDSLCYSIASHSFANFSVNTQKIIAMLSWTVIVLNIITRVHLGIIIQNPRNHSSKILRIFTSSQMNEARITSSLRNQIGSASCRERVCKSV